MGFFGSFRNRHARRSRHRVYMSSHFAEEMHLFPTASGASQSMVSLVSSSATDDGIAGRSGWRRGGDSWCDRCWVSVERRAKGGSS